MTLLVDTSALYALLDRDDPNHQSAKTFWASVRDDQLPVTHNYVLLETCALVQRRLGVEALQALVDEVLQPITTLFVDEELHRTAVAAVLAARGREVSLVDRVSFEVMRRLGFSPPLPSTPTSMSSGAEQCPTETTGQGSVPVHPRPRGQPQDALDWACGDMP